jgi:periplasmic copper chaperone A
MRIIILLLPLAFIAVACGDGRQAPAGEGGQAGEEAIVVEEAWARPVTVSEGSRVHSAAYFTLRNLGSEPVRLLAAESDVAARTEVHETRLEDGVMRMRARDDVEIPAGESLLFEPGGLHVMLMEVRQDLVAGDSLALVLRFDDGTEHRASVTVRPATL